MSHRADTDNTIRECPNGKAVSRIFLKNTRYKKSGRGHNKEKERNHHTSSQKVLNKLYQVRLKGVYPIGVSDMLPELHHFGF